MEIKNYILDIQDDIMEVQDDLLDIQNDTLGVLNDILEIQDDLLECKGSLNGNVKQSTKTHPQVGEVGFLGSHTLKSNVVNPLKCC